MRKHLIIVASCVASFACAQFEPPKTDFDGAENSITASNGANVEVYSPGQILLDGVAIGTGAASTGDVAAVEAALGTHTNDATIHFTNPGFVTQAVTNGLASEAYVTAQNYVTQAVTNGLASEAYVTAQNYVTQAVTNGLASEAYVTAQNYVTQAVTNGLASEAYVIAATAGVSTAWVDLDGTGSNEVDEISIDEKMYLGGETIDGVKTNLVVADISDFDSPTDAEWQGSNGVLQAAIDAVPEGDFLADGTVPMTGNFRLGGNWLSNDGGNEGVKIATDGKVAINGADFDAELNIKSDGLSSDPLQIQGVAGNPLLDFYEGVDGASILVMFNTNSLRQIRLSGDGRIITGTATPNNGSNSITAAGGFFGDGSALTDVPFTPPATNTTTIQFVQPVIMTTAAVINDNKIGVSNINGEVGSVYGSFINASTNGATDKNHALGIFMGDQSDTEKVTGVSAYVRTNGAVVHVFELSKHASGGGDLKLYDETEAEVIHAHAEAGGSYMDVNGNFSAITGGGSGFSPNSGADEFFVDSGSVNAGISIASAANSSIMFARSGQTKAAYIQYILQGGSGYMRFGLENNKEYIRMNDVTDTFTLYRQPTCTNVANSANEIVNYQTLTNEVTSATTGDKVLEMDDAAGANTEWTEWAIGGTQNQNDNWRIGVVSSNLTIQVRVGGSWVDATSFTRP